MKAPFKQVRWLLIKPCMEVFWKWCPTVNQVSFRSQSDINLYYNTTTGWRGFFLSRDGLLSNWITSSRSSTTWSSECDNTQLPLFFFSYLVSIVLLSISRNLLLHSAAVDRWSEGQTNISVDASFLFWQTFVNRYRSCHPEIWGTRFLFLIFYFDFSSSRSAKESCSILIWERWNWR